VTQETATPPWTRPVGIVNVAGSMMRSSTPGSAFRRDGTSTSVATTPTRVVHGLSTHYIPITVPANAKGIGVGVAAVSGPNPEVKLVVDGPKGRVIEGVLRQKGKLQYFVSTFRNAKERAHMMLIVTSGRQIGTAYKVAYQAL